MPTREELDERVTLINAGFDGRTAPMGSAINDRILKVSLFRDRWRAVRFREVMKKWPGYLRCYTRAGGSLEYYQWVHFIDGYNAAGVSQRLYALAVPEANTITIMVYTSDPSEQLLDALANVT